MANKRRRRKDKRKLAQTAGLPPGTLLQDLGGGDEKLQISLFEYTAAGFSEKEVKTIEDYLSVRKAGSTSWLNVDGIHNAEVLKRLGEDMKIHSLVLEDIQITDQRAKVEDYGKYHYLTFKMIRWVKDLGEPIFEQVSLILGGSYIISFQQLVGDVFDTIRERIRKGKGRVRNHGADYLAYSLIDAVVDNYILVAEELSAKCESLEEKTLFESDRAVLLAIHELKRQVMSLRKAIIPIREMIHSIQRDVYPLISSDTKVFFKDVHDHALEVLDTVEQLRDELSSLIEYHGSAVNNTTNSVMKVLTIISAIFSPLTFMVGVYGMNFHHMPELSWPWSYPILWGVMILVAGSMVVFFRRNKWF